MDHSASRKGPDGVGAHQQISYSANKAGYQRLRAAPNPEISQWSTLVHQNLYGIPRHLLTWIRLSLCCQNRGEISTKEEVRLWTSESTVEAKKGKPCPTKHKKTCSFFVQPSLRVLFLENAI